VGVRSTSATAGPSALTATDRSSREQKSGFVERMDSPAGRQRMHARSSCDAYRRGSRAVTHS
jgi:ribosomal protein L34